MKNLDSTQMSKRKGIIQSPQYCPPPSIQKRFFFKKKTLTSTWEIDILVTLLKSM